MKRSLRLLAVLLLLLVPLAMWRGWIRFRHDWSRDAEIRLELAIDRGQLASDRRRARAEIEAAARRAERALIPSRDASPAISGVVVSTDVPGRELVLKTEGGQEVSVPVDGRVIVGELATPTDVDAVVPGDRVTVVAPPAPSQ